MKFSAKIKPWYRRHDDWWYMTRRINGRRVQTKLAKGAEVDRSIHITDPVEYDGVVVATDPDETVAAFAQEAYRHHKTIGVVAGDPVALGFEPEDPGVQGGPDGFFGALALHRHWDR